MKLPPYSKYRSSGVEWLGEVPEHWEALPLKRRHRIVNGGTPSSAEDNYWNGDINWITPEDLGRNDSKRIGSSHRTLSLEGLSNCGAQLVPRDSIVVSTRAPIGHVAITERESCTNQGCRALVPEGRRACADYVYYTLFASHPVLQAAGKGTTFMELSAGLLGLHAVPFPPREEQRAIADFLDRETAKIDMLVAKKRTLIERLKEKRTALISRTVTRGLPPDAARAAGLDPHPKFKPSGIDWLGDVPEHWRVTRLSRIVACLDGRRIPLNREERSERQGPYPYWGANGVVDSIDEWLFDEPLVLLGEDGAPFFSANKEVAFFVTGKIWVNNHAHVLRPAAGIDGEFLTHALNETEYGAFIDGSTRDKLTQDEMNAIPVAMPPESEQFVIAAWLRHQAATSGQMIAKVETAIERLQEYRTALITAAVTGKIDVRNSHE